MCFQHPWLLGLCLPVNTANAIGTPIIETDDISDLPGVSVGAFTVRSAVAAGVAYDSNIFEEEMLMLKILMMMPFISCLLGINLKSNFVNDSIEFDIGLDSISYQDRRSE